MPHQLLGDFNAIEHGHSDVEDNDLRSAAANTLKHSSTIGGRGDNLELAPEDGDKFLQKCRIIISHYNAQSHAPTWLKDESSVVLCFRPARITEVLGRSLKKRGRALPCDYSKQTKLTICVRKVVIFASWQCAIASITCTRYQPHGARGYTSKPTKRLNCGVLLLICARAKPVQELKV
jgi:hypothetical protein